MEQETLPDDLADALVGVQRLIRRRLRREMPAPHPRGAEVELLRLVAARPGIEPRLGSGMVAYATAKAAVAAMTEALAQETAGEEIWINAVAPSIRYTFMSISDSAT